MTDLQRPSSTVQRAASAPPVDTDEDKDGGGASTAVQQGKETAQSAADAAGQTAKSAADAAGQTAQTAANAGRQVASEAAAKAGEVTKQATAQAGELVEKAQAQFREQASSQTSRAAGGLRGLSDELRSLGDGQPQPGMAADAGRQLADKLADLASGLE